MSKKDVSSPEAIGANVSIIKSNDLAKRVSCLYVSFDEEFDSKKEEDKFGVLAGKINATCANESEISMFGEVFDCEVVSYKLCKKQVSIAAVEFGDAKLIAKTEKSKKMRM